MTYKDTQERYLDALQMERNSCLCDVAEDESDGDEADECHDCGEDTCCCEV